MCTILAAVGVWPDLPLVIAANRDEALDRPASAPQLWPAGEVGARAVFAPRDLKAGGTWLGLNDAELFVGITNRRAATDSSRRSRGELVFTALGAAGHADGRARVLALDPRAYNPFHLLLADRSGAVVIWSDGERLHEHTLAPGVHWITERSFGAGDSRRHQLLAELTTGLTAGPAPDSAHWRSVLADHRPHHAQNETPGTVSVGFDSMCVHAGPLNYGTRSSTLIELGRVRGQVRFLHAQGRPCENDFVDYRETLVGLVARHELE
jgi:uncharacterized protein with NRDE domain